MMNKAAMVMSRRRKRNDSVAAARTLMSLAAIALAEIFLEGFDEDPYGCDYQLSYIKLDDDWLDEYNFEYVEEEGD